MRFLGDLPDVQRGDHFQMVESPGYYESYCHNLQGLQELADDKMHSVDIWWTVKQTSMHQNMLLSFLIVMLESIGMK